MHVRFWLFPWHNMCHFSLWCKRWRCPYDLDWWKNSWLSGFEVCEKSSSAKRNPLSRNNSAAAAVRDADMDSATHPSSSLRRRRQGRHVDICKAKGIQLSHLAKNCPCLCIEMSCFWSSCSSLEFYHRFWEEVQKEVRCSTDYEHREGHDGHQFPRADENPLLLKIYPDCEDDIEARGHPCFRQKP